MHVKDLDELEDKARAFRENQGHIAVYTMILTKAFQAVGKYWKDDCTEKQ